MTDATVAKGLKALFLGHQEILKAELIQARTGVEHPTLKGDGSEGRWRSVLEKHIPRRYRICRGVVVDSAGTESDAVDVIIHDAHFCPLLLDKDGTCFVPAESVYAVFETKQALNAGQIQYAGKKAASVRRLHRTSAPIVDRGEARPARELPPILAGVLALEAEWVDGLGAGFTNALSKLQADQHLDLAVLSLLARSRSTPATEYRSIPQRRPWCRSLFASSTGCSASAPFPQWTGNATRPAYSSPSWQGTTLDTL